MNTDINGDFQICISVPLKINGLGAKVPIAFLSFFFLSTLLNYNILKSQNPFCLLKKNINFNKHEMKSKIENPTHTLKEMSLVPQFV